MIVLIVANLAGVVLETVAPIHAVFSSEFYILDLASVIIFTIEYLVRVWVVVERSNPRFRDPVRGRITYMLSPLAIVDLLAVLPFYLSSLFGMDLRFLRIFRLLRILKLTRYSHALETLGMVFRAEAQSLFAAFTIMMTLLVCLSSIVYHLEQDVQPEVFGSIPEAMWWGMATLTTVGYGDVVPVTPMGKLVGAIVTLAGLGMFALPAAILASGFAQAAKRRDFTVSWNLVAQVPIFSHLRADEIADIASLLHARLAAPGEIILKKGTYGHEMYFISSGEVEVLIPDNHVRLGPGDFFGELAILFETTRTADVRALTTCELLTLDTLDIEELFKRHPVLKEELESTAKARMGRLPDIVP